QIEAVPHRAQSDNRYGGRYWKCRKDIAYLGTFEHGCGILFRAPPFAQLIARYSRTACKHRQRQPVDEEIKNNVAYRIPKIKIVRACVRAEYISFPTQPYKHSLQ